MPSPYHYTTFFRFAAGITRILAVLALILIEFMMARCFQISSEEQ